MQIKNQIAVVTGAGSGLGAATAKALAQAGAKVALLDIHLTETENLAKEIQGLAFPCDVRDEKNVANVIQEVIKKMGFPRIDVNCAGIATVGGLVNQKFPLSLADVKRAMEINFVGTLNVMHALTHEMIKQEPVNEDGERGIIVNTASIAAFDGQSGQIAYSASKGAVVSMTLPAARELGKWGIRVVCLAPGVMKTAMLKDIPEPAMERLIAQIPFPKRLGKPQEFSQAVIHAIENPLLNGCTIRLDGALRMV